MLIFEAVLLAANCHAMRSLWNCTWVSRSSVLGLPEKWGQWACYGCLLSHGIRILLICNLYMGILSDDQRYRKWGKMCQLLKCVGPIKEIRACFNHYYLIFCLSFIESPGDFNWAHVWQRCNSLHLKNPLVQNRNVITNIWILLSHQFCAIKQVTQDFDTSPHWEHQRKGKRFLQYLYEPFDFYLRI